MTANDVSDFGIGELGFEIVSRLKTPTKIQSLISEEALEMGLESEEDINYLKDQILNQIKEALKIGALYIYHE